MQFYLPVGPNRAPAGPAPSSLSVAKNKAACVVYYAIYTNTVGRRTEGVWSYVRPPGTESSIPTATPAGRE